MFGSLVFNIINTFSKNKILKIDFRMIEIKDKNNELVRARIPRKDLFRIQKNIIDSDDFLLLINNFNSVKTVSQYLKKSVIEGFNSGGIHDIHSGARVLFLINVVFWYSKKLESKINLLMINKRPWFSIYRDYAKLFDIDLILVSPIKYFFEVRNGLKRFIKKRDKLFIYIKNIKNRNNHYSIKNNSKSLIFNEGRGDINLLNDGLHSDLFWLLNSDFPPDTVLLDVLSKIDKKKLEEIGVIVNNYTLHFHNLKIKKYKVNKIVSNTIERDQLSYKLDHFNSLVSYWCSMITTYNIKVFFTWYFHTSDHIAIKQAFSLTGGLFVIWPQSYHGAIDTSSIVSADTIFHYSLSSAKMDLEIQNDFNYMIITGYPKDYAACLLKSTAIQIRNKLKKNGAKIIVSILDENSLDDDRWHTGHGLQKDNYIYPLQLALETPWLGLIFKPKVAKNLRKRLGDVTELLDKGIATGRVMIFEESGNHTTLAPPVLAGMASDVCIHGHYGTASLECALQGVKTLVIDREGEPFHKFNSLPKDKIVFSNWSDALSAFIEHIENPSGISGFGDWSDYLDEFDPFRDGKAAYRMGRYLNWLQEGFDAGMDKDAILADSAEKYGKEWGNDKVIYNSS